MPMSLTLSKCLLLLQGLYLLAPSVASDFNVKHYGAVGDGKTDDSQAFMKAWDAVCKDPGAPTFLVPGCERFLIHPVVFQGPCVSKRIKFKVEGTLAAPKIPKEWRCTDKGCDSWIRFKHVDGITITGSGTIDGDADKWWKGGRVTGSRPNSLVVTNSNHVRLRDLNFKDSPHMHVVFYHCKGVKISNVDISAPGDSPNTDGIHLKEVSNVVIEYCTIRTGDDCISMVHGSTHIDVKYVNCGPGHGISIGSLGKDGEAEMVENVHVKNVRFNETTNGVRIKTWEGGKGYIRNVIFEKIRTFKAEYPINIDQYYCDHSDCTKSTDAVQIRNISYIDIRGTSKGTAVKLACNPTVPCRDIFMKDINLIGGKKQVLTDCRNVVGGSFNGVMIPDLPCFGDGPKKPSHEEIEF